MEKDALLGTLSSIYSPPLDGDRAWDCYTNFMILFLEDDSDTVNYLYTICELTHKQRLLLRNKISEHGFELTPNELNQYIFLILLAMSEYLKVKDC